MSKHERSKSKTIKDDTSKYDPSRKTVGAIYRDAQLASHDTFVLAGDLSNEMINSLVDDLNNTIESDPFDGHSFYITVHEKKDLQMKRAILRRMIVSKFRPFPEDDTIVFHIEPRQNTCKFCWCLPHHTQMLNVLANPYLYDINYVNDVKAWKAERWDHFGFTRETKVQDKKDNKDVVLTK